MYRNIFLYIGIIIIIIIIIIAIFLLKNKTENSENFESGIAFHPRYCSCKSCDYNNKDMNDKICQIQLDTLDNAEPPNLKGSEKSLFPPSTMEIYKKELNEYGTTYYKNPKLMSHAQQIKFIQTAKFDNMQCGDYANWLLLTNKLAPEYLKRSPTYARDLDVLKNGGHITLNMIPSDPTLLPPPPANEETYYKEYIENQKITF